MSNTLTSVMPKILAQGLLALRQEAAIIRTVNVDWANETKQKGDTIDVPTSSAITAQDVTPGATPPSTADTATDKVQIQLNKWKEAPFYLTDKELGEIMVSTVINGQVAEAAKSLANQVAADLYACYKGVYGFAGTPGTTPFGTAENISDATAVRKVLNKQLAPLSPRRAILDPDAEANALGQRAFSDSSWRNDPNGIIEGQVARKLGIDWLMDQLIPTHTSTALSAGACTVNGAHAAGVTTVSIAKATNTSPLVEGDIITFAGFTQTYVVTANATLAVGNTNVSIQPALALPLAGGEAVSLKASHVVNLAFHRDAFALAIRPLEAPHNGLGNLIMSAQDPKTGLALRLEISREHKRTRYSFDILYGVKLVRAALAARLAG